MSAADPRRYQPVCVEDWDDEAEAPLPGTRTTANVAVKRDLSSDFDLTTSPVIRYKNDGTDSGYASQATTISSRASMASSSRRRDSDLKLDTVNIGDRERKPYAMTATPREVERPSTKPKPAEPKETKPVKKPFCHKEGICWVCDKYGYHFDPKDLSKKETSKPATPAPQPSASQPKKEVTKPKADDAPRPPSRRMSSNQARPTSMYVAAPVQAPFVQYTSMPPPVWPSATPPPPTSVPQYSYYMPPATPVYNMQMPQQLPLQPQKFYYEPQPVFEDYPPSRPQPSRRTSMIQERPKLEKKPSRQHTVVERTASQEYRPQIVSHKSSRSIDADRAAMPPPPKPTPATINTMRPRAGRSNTYHSNGSSNRNSRYEEDSDEEYEIQDPRIVTKYKEPPSPSRPPSSYRKLPVQHEVVDRSRLQKHEQVERPRMQEKSKSYEQGSNTVQVASARVMPRRRTTESAPPPKSIDHDLATAEAYIRKRGSFPINDLTAENLKTLKTVATRQVSDQRSDSGSTGSHATHQSGSKDSSNGRGRGVSGGSTVSHATKTSMNININGLNLNITDGGNNNGDGPPVRIDLGAIQLSMNNRNRDKENIDYRPKQQKQLERAPSVSSRPSRRSLTNGGMVSSGRDREEQLAIEGPGPREPRPEYMRRPSFADEDEREALRRSAKSSRQASRNTSHSRQATIDDVPVRPRPNRASVDYSARRDESSVM